MSLLKGSILSKDIIHYIGDDTINRIDWCALLPRGNNPGVVLLKKEFKLMAFDLTDFLNKNFSKALKFGDIDTIRRKEESLNQWIIKIRDSDKYKYVSNDENLTNTELEVISINIAKMMVED